MKFKLITFYSCIGVILFSNGYADIPVYNSPSDLNYPVVSPQGMGDTTRPFFNLSGGPAFATPGSTQTVYIDPNYSNTYTSDSGSQTLAQFELYIGMQVPVMGMMLMQLGPFVGVAGVASPDGEILQYSDPEFNNMRYTYNLSQGRAGLRVKLAMDNEYDTMFASPYVTGSAGFAINYSYSYRNYDIIAPAVANPNFGNNSQAAFSYSLGAGLQRDINCNFRIGLGYEYTSWGKSSLGVASGQLTDNTLTLSNLYMQSVLLSLTYIV